MSSNPGDGVVEGNGNLAPNPGPIIHQRADSDSCLEELFTFVLKPPNGPQMAQKPLRMRNLPQSFFNPPQSGGSRSPSCHTRESSFDGSSLQGPFSPQPVQQHAIGSPQQLNPAQQPMHTRAHSSPANLQQTMAAVQQQQQQQQQHFHLRQPSCDATQGPPDFGPLPPGWEPARTPQGALYFMNHITKTTQWEDPRIQIHQQQLKEQEQEVMSNVPISAMTPQQKQILMSRPLPQGWEQAVTPEGEIYFINHITKSTSWFDPRLPMSGQNISLRVGGQQAQQHQQQLRLQRLENERRLLQQRQAELQKMEQNRLQMLRQQQQQLGHPDLQAAVNATQEMLMRHTLNGDVGSSCDSFRQRQLEMQHIREESADSGLGMGSTLGSIPEDPSLDSMDTDLDTTLTEAAVVTPTAASVMGCGMQQQQQLMVDDQQKSMEAGGMMVGNDPLMADLDIAEDFMQTILTSQNPQQQILATDGPLWL